MSNFENKVLKKKKLDKELNLIVTQNDMSKIIFVDFVSENGRMKLQKSFQNTYDGKKASQKFQKSIKSIVDLKKYFGIK
jgi:hypothetical protein